MIIARPTRGPAVVAVAAAGALLIAPIALAGVATAKTGNVKVHAKITANDDQRNEPDPGCSFYLVAYSATPGATFRVTFEPQGGANVAGEPTTATDDYTTNQDFAGNPNKQDDGRSRLFNQDPDSPEILNGQYKVTITNLADAGDTETKVFRVSGCPGGGGPDPDEPTPTPRPDDPNDPDDPDNGDVGGVGIPEDQDDGPGGVGGVETGGGGSAPGGGSAAPWLLLTGTGAAAVALGARRFRSAG